MRDNTKEKLKQWLGENNQIGMDTWEKKYRYNNESFDEWLDRVSGGDAKLRQLIMEWHKKESVNKRTLLLFQNFL